MNKLITFILGAAAGAAAGSFITYKLVEEKFKNIADEEIESVRELYMNKLNKLAGTEEPVEVKENNTINIPEEYSDLVEDLGYSSGDEEDDSNYEIYVEPGVDRVEPYVINPDEFGEVYDYDKKSWTYYADGVLTDEVGNVIVDTDNLIGDALDHFGEYEDDSVHVRNENEGWDIEILKHEKSFYEINGVDI